MATLIEAINKYRPRIEYKGVTQTQQIINDMAELSSLSKGDVASFLQDLEAVIIKYLREGNSVDIQGIGRFHPSISTDGVIKVNIIDAPQLETELNKPHSFTGTITNKDNIGPDNQKIINAWNKAHPDNPVEISERN